MDIDKNLADSETVDSLFMNILGRRINNDDFKREINDVDSINSWVRRLIGTDEFRQKFLKSEQASQASDNFIANEVFRTPSLSGRLAPPRIIITGSCLSEPWKDYVTEAYPTTEVLHILFNNCAELPDMSVEELRNSAFQVGQIGLRSIVSDDELFSSAFAYGNEGKAEKVFDACVTRLRHNIRALRKYHDQAGIPLFILNFIVPQIPPLGRMLPKRTLTNYAFFISELNRILEEDLASERGIHVIDLDAITSSLGKRFFSDDVSSHSNHGGFINGAYAEHELNLTAVGSYDEIFAPKAREVTLAAFNECCAAYETLTSDKKIKLVIFDLDGTLWRGIAAESDALDYHFTEGWPLGLLEAASVLKKRGILIAIASKNEAKNVEAAWDQLYERRFPLSNFVCVKANWNQKVQNIQEILAETNILPGNVLFVDDNPVEREQVVLAYPEMKIISGPISTWRRTLLWGTELQVPFITAESIHRTESIKNVIVREEMKSHVDVSDYIANLNVELTVGRIRDKGHRRFSRAFELINKTNQFNTTGRRWSEAEIDDYFADGGELIYATAVDRLSEYGLIAVVLCRGNEATQFVMSCRVFGLRVEYALADYFLRRSKGAEGWRFLYKSTDKNGPARNFLSKLGFDGPTVNEPNQIVPFDLASPSKVLNGLFDGLQMKELGES